ncbi:hypothetical protein [Enemella sp. A6]|uniref:hypothetical protein n=1 Tax=Enemella sp. A6 TaxID=3440152 RepID=UPI003EB739C5
MGMDYRAWSTSVYMRQVHIWTKDGERVPAGYSEPVAVVFDPRGWAWHVTMDGDRITTLTVESVGTAEVDQSATRTVPLQHLREVAREVLQGLDDDIDDGAPIPEALEAAATPRGFVRVKNAPPSPQLFAHYWQNSPEFVWVDERKRGRRWRAAKDWGVTEYAVDKWLREARDLGLIPPSQRTINHQQEEQK